MFTSPVLTGAGISQHKPYKTLLCSNYCFFLFGKLCLVGTGTNGIMLDFPDGLTDFSL